MHLVTKIHYPVQRDSMASDATSEGIVDSYRGIPWLLGHARLEAATVFDTQLDSSIIETIRHDLKIISLLKTS